MLQPNNAKLNTHVIVQYLPQVSQEKEAMKDNRLLREQQYAEQKERDWEESIRKEIELHRSVKEQYDQAKELEMNAWRAAQVRGRQNLWPSHYCNGLSYAMALCSIAQRQSPLR